MKSNHYSYLIKPASSLCNLSCRYCFYHDVSEHRNQKSTGIMTAEVAHKLIENALNCESDASISFMFQGGEPTLAGIDYFIDFTAYVSVIKKEKQKIRYIFQTNGILIDEQWCQFFYKHQFLIGISIDGYAKNHNYCRPNYQGCNTLNHILTSVSFLRKYKVEFNILTVLTSILAKHPQKLYDFYRMNQFYYIQLIPCLPGLEEKKNTFSLTPKEFAAFYKAFYSLWLEDYQKGNYLSVTLFDNLIPMFLDIPPTQCGYLGFCSPQCVVESDGSVYPCDFYVLDRYYSGNVIDTPFETIRTCETTKTFLSEQKPRCNLCTSCPFLRFCHGNCKRMACVYYEENYCGYREFLEFAAPSMQQIAAWLRSQNRI